MELAPEKKALTEFVPIKSKEQPKASIKLEIGKKYLISDNYGAQKSVKITAIKYVESEYYVSYKYLNSTKYFGLIRNYSNGQTTVNNFKNQLVDYGKVNSVDIYYPVL